VTATPKCVSIGQHGTGKHMGSCHGLPAGHRSNGRQTEAFPDDIAARSWHLILVTTDVARVQYYLPVTRRFSELSRSISGEYWTLPRKVSQCRQALNAFWRLDWKSACRWFDSAPGHHSESKCWSRMTRA